MKVSKITMYLNRDRFAGGRTVLLARAVKQLSTSISGIANRSYLPVQDSGAFRDLYDSLNALNAELLLEGGKGEEQCRHFADIMLKNAPYMEALIDNLKLACQLPF